MVDEVAGDKGGNHKHGKRLQANTDHQGEREPGWEIPGADCGPYLEINGSAVQEAVNQDAGDGEEETPQKNVEGWARCRGSCSALKQSG